MTTSRVVRFGAFQVDMKTGELSSDGGRVVLQPQLLKVLSVLVEHHGDLVTREDLRQRVWGDDVFVDFEHSLNKAITKLRRALGDTAEKPRYIETLERRGYRFLPTLDAGDATKPPESVLRLALPDRLVPLFEGSHLIGRHPSAPIRIDSTDVSRRHALVTVQGQVATVTDLESRNGTFLNGKRITGTTVLRDRDEIRLGKTVVVFESSDACPPTAAITERAR